MRHVVPDYPIYGHIKLCSIIFMILNNKIIVACSGKYFLLYCVKLLLFLIVSSDFDGFQRMNKNTVFLYTLVGGPLGLECDILDAKPQPLIQWFDDHAIVAEVLRLIEYHDNGRILFVNILNSTQRTRKYHCEVSSPFLKNRIRAPTTFDISGNLTTENLTIYRSIPSVVDVLLGEPIMFPYPSVAPISLGSPSIAVCYLPKGWNGEITTRINFVITITGIERTGLFQITCVIVGGRQIPIPNLPPILFRVTSKTQV